MSDELFKKALPVIAILVLCGALITAIAMWVGPETPEPEVEITEKTT